MESCASPNRAFILSADDADCADKNKKIAFICNLRIQSTKACHLHDPAKFSNYLSETRMPERIYSVWHRSKCCLRAK